VTWLTQYTIDISSVQTVINLFSLPGDAATTTTTTAATATEMSATQPSQIETTTDKGNNS